MLTLRGQARDTHASGQVHRISEARDQAYGLARLAVGFVDQHRDTG